MNQKQHIAILPFLLLALFSCSNGIDKKIDFGREVKLIADRVPIHEIFGGDFITLKDSFLIVASSVSDTTLFVYSLPDLRFLNVEGMKGGGPEEMQLFPMFCESPGSEYLYVWGYTPAEIRKFSIQPDGRFVLRDRYTLDDYETRNNIQIINDSILIYYLIEDLTIKKEELKKDISLGEIVYPKEDHRESYYYSNRGLIATNSSKLVYAYLFKREIDIYDIATFKRTIVVGDGVRHPAPDLSMAPQDVPSYYRNIYAGETYFYILCKENGLRGVGDWCLYVFDYDGNSIIRYLFDIPPFLFVVDEKRGYLYGYNGSYEDIFLRYKLPASN